MIDSDSRLAGHPTHIVVGAGSAGATIAARLAADERLRVLLIEAGEDEYPLRMRIPAGVFGLIGNPSYDWSYPGRDDATLGGRRLAYPAGRVVGGSSSINGLVYARGDRRDYEHWVEAGATGWGWDDVLSYFRRSEAFAGEASGFHGTDGPLGVSRSQIHPVATRLLDACDRLGIRRREDYATGDIDGAFPAQATIRNGRRTSTRDFLKGMRGKPNLEVMSGTKVARILFEERRAVGVDCHRPDGTTLTLRCEGEVVVAAGAFGTPLLLQRSGLGSGSLLKNAGIAVIKDDPAIGQNLRDHLSNGIARNVTCPTFNNLRNPVRAAKAGLDWLLSGSGPLASCSVHAMVYGRSDPDLDRPDFMLSFLPINTDWSTGKPRIAREQGVFIAVNTCRTHATGSVAIGGPTMADAPVIDYPLLVDERDIAAMLGGLRLIETLCGTEPLRSVMAPAQPEPLPSGDAEWRSWLRDRTALGYHSVGTCRMGGEDAPLDPELRMRGVERLRIADASAMPALVSGNTNAAAIMIGERAADFILQAS